MSDGYRVIYEAVHGSQAFGLATPASDLDRKGVIVGPPAWYHGFRGGPEQVELGADHVRFEVRKFVRLGAAANPVVLELLWCEPDCHLALTPPGERLLAARAAFLSRRVADTFGGYALSQLKRIRTHRRWLLHPPAREPQRADFGLPAYKPVPGDQLGAAEALLAQGRLAEADLTPNFLELLDREKRYRQARREWEQYRTWLRSRNPARAALEARHGYDTKHAQHLVRLLRMALEILADGVVRVRRADHEELRAIRAGALSYDELMAQAEALHERVLAAAATTALPKAPDEDALDALCQQVIEEVLA
jgi:hypothetical protein